MAKNNILFDYLRDPTHRDSMGPLILNSNPKRLALRFTSVPGSWREVAAHIVGPLRHLAWFPDSNVAIRNETSVVWEAFRIATLSTNQNSAFITGVIKHELSEWLQQPFRNQQRAEDIAKAIQDGTWLKLFKIGTQHPLFSVVQGYAHLLGYRRILACQLPSGTTIAGTNATDKSATMALIGKEFGNRALSLAKKGRIDVDERGLVNINDEIHCLSAVVHALTTRRHSAIITADADFLEIFYKIQWFFDRAYFTTVY